MAELNYEDRFSGPNMIQDRNHMSDIHPRKKDAGNGESGRGQVDQSESTARQQGSVDQNASRQQGGERTGERKRRLL